METGNVKAIREALESVRNWCLNRLVNSSHQVTVEGLLSVVNTALAKPPRNCDVGTAEEQARRYEELCDSHTCGSICSGSCCPLYDYDCSPFAWAQMPYEEEAER